MTETSDGEPGNGLALDVLPSYTAMLSAYHRSRAADLRAIVATLPLTPRDRVLDVACGDGTFSMLLAERCGEVVGVDLSSAYIAHAQEQVLDVPRAVPIHFQQADVAQLGFADGSFDFAWCAQSLFSLPDPLVTLREMVRVTRPGGFVAILENDSLHHLIMPLPIELELALKQAQLRALREHHRTRGVDKFYVGRDLSGLLLQVGLHAISARTFAVERHAPLDADETMFIHAQMTDLRKIADPYLDEPTRASFAMLFNRDSDLYLLRQPEFHLTHLEMLAVGRK